MIDWKYWIAELVVYAGSNPWQFIYTVLLCLSPLFAISAYLSWQLATQIDQKEKDKKRKAKREANLNKLRKNKSKAE